MFQDYQQEFASQLEAASSSLAAGGDATGALRAAGAALKAMVMEARKLPQEERRAGKKDCAVAKKQLEKLERTALLGAGGGGAAGAGAGAAGCAKLEAGEEAVLSRIQAVQTSWTCFHLSTFAILRASCHRRISACSRLSACFAARAAQVQRCGAGA